MNTQTMERPMTAAAAVKHAILIEEFQPVNRNTLRCFAKIVLPSGMILSDVSVHIKNGSAWASPASKPMLGVDGTALRDAGGKVRYVPIVSFATKELRDKFSSGVIEAIRATYPDALQP